MATTPLGRASDRLNALQASRPEVVRLAMAACLAVRIEPHLLRRLRIECVPEADVGAEADLWFSRLVESRGVQAIVLDRHVARVLREHLGGDRGLLERVSALTAEAHASSPAALQLEEQVNCVALLDGEAAPAKINELLQPAVRALKESDERGREIARWWLRAAPRLHAMAWRSDNALALLVGSSVLLQRRIETGTVPMPSASIERLAWALPAGIDVGHLNLSVELGPDRLAFREPRGVSASIRVPATTPPIIDARWRAGGSERRVVTEIAPDVEIDLGAGASDVTLTTLRGAVYEIGSDTHVMNKQRCFVSMPFGRKTDFETGRTLDMDAVYQSAIKPAVEEAGLECLRADEIVHAGIIDVPMFEQLLDADFVIVDLSTANVTVAYELGVRHALRPYSTLVIAEDGRRHAFAGSHFAVRSYRHLGEDLGANEARRLRKNLTDAIVETVNDGADRTDSPVYQFLPDLVPPVRTGSAAQQTTSAQASRKATPSFASETTRRALMLEVDEAQKKGDFVRAKALLQSIRATSGGASGTTSQSDDPYIIQRLALATYQSKAPSPEAALMEARALLETLQPSTSNDTETLGLWGAIHKRLWNLTRDRKHLSEAIRAHERGFYLRNDEHNGINLAFLLNTRAAQSDDLGDAIADFVAARRIREEVVALAERSLELDDAVKSAEVRYWTRATRAEALVGLGASGARTQLESLYTSAPAAWMMDATREQIIKLESLLSRSPMQLLDEGARSRWASVRHPQ